MIGTEAGYLLNRIPRGHFLFTCSDTCAAGCIVQPQHTSSQTDRQTDRRQYHANSRSYCVAAKSVNKISDSCPKRSARL